MINPRPRINTSPVVISAAEDSDFPAIQEIYAPYVLSTTISMEETPPDVQEMKERWQKSRKNSLPFIVAKIDGTIVGYAYAIPYGSRSCYRFTLEESVYIAEGFKGRKIGHQLLSEVINVCSKKDYKQLVAIIAGENIPSIAFHESLGFRTTGRLEKVGFKFGRWIDMVVMQKAL